MAKRTSHFEILSAEEAVTQLGYTITKIKMPDMGLVWRLTDEAGIQAMYEEVREGVVPFSDVQLSVLWLNKGKASQSFMVAGVLVGRERR